MTKFVAPSIQSSAYKPSPVSKCLGEWQGDVRKIWWGGGKRSSYRKGSPGERHTRRNHPLLGDAFVGMTIPTLLSVDHNGFQMNHPAHIAGNDLALFII